MAVHTVTLTFDPAQYVNAVTALGFDPHIAVLPDGSLKFRETTPWPISAKTRKAYRKHFESLYYTPGASTALMKHLLETLRFKRGEVLN